MAKRSCSRESDRDGVWPGLVVLKSLGENAQGEHFGFRHGFVGSGSIGENSREFGDFSKPAPVFFAFVFNCEIHVAPRRLNEFYARSHFAIQRKANRRARLLHASGLGVQLGVAFGTVMGLPNRETASRQG